MMAVQLSSEGLLSSGPSCARDQWRKDSRKADIPQEFGKGARGNGHETYGEGDYASVYTAAPLLPAALLRSIAAYAGCHVYNEQNDVLYAGDGILAVHAAKPGRRHLRLPRPATVRELYTGELIGKSIEEFDYNFEQPGTAVFYLGEGSPSESQ